MISIRSYAASDYQACLRLFDSNVPDFFAPCERQDFEGFLDRAALKRCYVVVEQSSQIVACGGHLVEADGQTAGLCWGMVDRGVHKTGLGRLLLEARLDLIRKSPGLKRVRLDTSQHSQAFYTRFGFQVEAVTRDGYEPGLDRWDMLLCL